MVKKFSLGMPDFVTIRTEEKELITTFENGQAALDDVVIRMETTEEQVNAYVKADESPVKTIALRWKMEAPKGAKILGDEWERGYGLMEWKTLRGGRPMPWYFHVSTENKEYGYGVKVRPSAMCFWLMDLICFPMHPGYAVTGLPPF